MSEYKKLQKVPQPGDTVWVSRDGSYFRRGRFVRVSENGLRWKIILASDNKERAVEPILVFEKLNPEQAREFLRKEITKSIDDIDIEQLKDCCICLFKHGNLDDALLIWGAKESCFDAHCSIDVQFLCGQGLEKTKQYLTGLESPEAKEALEYLIECEATGDFEKFSPVTWASYYE